MEYLQCDSSFLESRINATTIAELETHGWIQSQFVSYLAHVSGLVLPMSLGDTYSQLGDYQQVRILLYEGP